MTLTLLGKNVNLRTLYCPVCVGQGKRTRIVPTLTRQDLVLDCPCCQHVTHIPLYHVTRREHVA